VRNEGASMNVVSSIKEVWMVEPDQVDQMHACKHTLHDCTVALF